ncbi:flagellar biosynthetic protein FliR [Caballeronia sp. dw_19]|uniref:flagellar biosynthetic protein FliR n=1 Tax=Caballeronia sp. dw_19 TaxID=2719791 RepID=UPI001BCEFCFC|nr:flagellar biosynthetic protein FliR [Caballeronia sp. dw_19]
MEQVFRELQPLVATIMWPFCRIVVALLSAPVLGEVMVPMRARIMLALLLAVVIVPGLPAMPAVEPLSLQGSIAMAEQILIGGMLGFVFHLVLAALMIFGATVSSQMGLSMAQINDPLNGQSSDVVSSLMYVVFILLFFAVDGHLLITQILVKSFHIWPVGSLAFDTGALKRLALALAWMFSAALALSLPVVFATMVMQIGLGFLNRVAPTLNLFALGFSVTTMFGLLLLTLLMPSLPDHFNQMISHVLNLLDQLALPPRTELS